MTTQGGDFVLYNGDKYELLGHTESYVWSLLSLYGMEHGSCYSTASYRGYFADYVVIADCLYLDALTLVTKGFYYPEINGIKPERSDLYTANYSNLRIVLPIDGIISIGNSIPENWSLRFVEFRKPHDYMRVLKLSVQQGYIQDVIDISDQAILIRDALRRIKKVRWKQPELYKERYWELHQQSRALMES